MSKISSLFRPRNKRRAEPDAFFRSDHYTQHNARRLEHLASLGIEVAGKTVLELGAGIGDHSHYYIDRGCTITITEARRENLDYLRQRYSGHSVLHLDLEAPEIPAPGQFQVVHCYGVLYHLHDPAGALAFISKLNSELLLLETCVSFGDEAAVNIVAEDAKIPTQSFSGKGCRPTRPWIFRELRKHYGFVYVPRTQPNFREFPIDWTKSDPYKDLLTRAVFIASRQALSLPQLSPELLSRQVRHP